jgi:hypothetical protein
VAEYKSMPNATVEIMWLQSLLKELHTSLVHKQLASCDNMSAKYLSLNPVFHSHMKHIEVDYHFNCVQVVQHKLNVHFILTHDQLADGFTKALPQQ